MASFDNGAQKISGEVIIYEILIGNCEPTFAPPPLNRVTRTTVWCDWQRKGRNDPIESKLKIGLGP
jgi:hypothetical protein